MTPAVQQLVAEAMALTGAAAPDLMEADAPVLADTALSDERDFYLIGIIGGKDVGKSALVNALVGRPITAITSHGPGTEGVVAYVHSTQSAKLRALLEREVPGQHQIVTHELPHLARQVLLDLPDIDSHWRSHAAVTRAMLRHMLFPIWVQSIEKYADRQPQQMLARVAEGNAPGNFLFCLNKIDQLQPQGGPPSAEAEEIRQDFARRLAGTLSLDRPPQVFLISALRPDAFDLPKLRALVAKQKPADQVAASLELAVHRQDQSALRWLAELDLAGRAERLDRLRQEGEELVSQRVGEPLTDKILPALSDDPANRLCLSDEILRRRVTRWPLVNLVHTLLSPLLAVWRTNVSGVGRIGLPETDALVESHIGRDGRNVAAWVQSTFAQLRQPHPQMVELYPQRKLWEEMPAAMAAIDLRERLAQVVERQRVEASEKIAGRGGLIAPLFRWLLTIGALLWFPLVQPILEPFLRSGNRLSLRELGGLAVAVFSGEALLKNVSFLCLWFLIIWLALRWNTQRRVGRLLDKWRSPDSRQPELSFGTAALEWLDALTQPIATMHQRFQTLSEKVSQSVTTTRRPSTALTSRTNSQRVA